MPSSDQGASILIDTQDHQCIGVVRRQEFVTPMGVFPRRPQLPLLEVRDRSADAALAIVAKISAGVGALESEIAILLDAEPVRIRMACTAEVVELGLLSDKSNGSTTLLFDDFKSIFGPGNGSGAAPKGFRVFGGGGRGSG